MKGLFEFAILAAVGVGGYLVYRQVIAPALVNADGSPASLQTIEELGGQLGNLGPPVRAWSL